MSAILADTHAFVRYLFQPNLLSKKAAVAFDQSLQAEGCIYLSSISLVELYYLIEKKRLSKEVLSGLKIKIAEGIFKIVPLDYDITNAIPKIPRSIVADMPDRIIAATAFSLKIPLITADHQIRKTTVNTIW